MCCEEGRYRDRLNERRAESFGGGEAYLTGFRVQHTEAWLAP